jgi:orsellinic acid C2-O-methyltransferase
MSFENPLGKDEDNRMLADRFTSILTASWKTKALCVAAELRLADLLADGPRTATQLASSTLTEPQALHRLLRALSAIDICAEREDGSFELRPLGTILQEKSPTSLRAWTIWWGRYLWPVWGNLLHSVKTGESARKLLHGTDGFAHLDQDPEAADVFYQVTVELTRDTAEFVAQAYDFSSQEQIVDVGGGYGELLGQVLRKNPRSSGVLFDLPRAIEGARKHFKAHYPDVSERCTFITGDFFEAIPPGADTYLLKSVIHDWDAEQSIRILSCCRRAMRPESRLLVIEPTLPTHYSPSPSHAMLSQLDLTMLVALGGQERTQSEFSDILAATGLCVSRIVPAGPVFSIIETSSVSPA